MKKFFRMLWWYLWEHRYAEKVTATLLATIDNNAGFYGHSFDLSRLEQDNLIMLVAYCPKEQIDEEQYGIHVMPKQEFIIYRKKGIVIWEH